MWVKRKAKTISGILDLDWLPFVKWGRSALTFYCFSWESLREQETNPGCWVEQHVCSGAGVALNNGPPEGLLSLRSTTSLNKIIPLEFSPFFPSSGPLNCPNLSPNIAEPRNFSPWTNSEHRLNCLCVSNIHTSHICRKKYRGVFYYCHPSRSFLLVRWHWTRCVKVLTLNS